MLKHLALPLGLLLLLTVPMACTEKEQTSLGMDLQDPFTLYEGIRDTAYMTACTIYDDSLWTAGYEYGIFGDYEDAVFGKAEAVVYSQIAIPTTTGINLSDEVVIDSVVMTLVIDTLYPSVPDSTPVPLHVIIKQLDEPMMDSSYRMTLSSQHLKESDVCFFDGEVTYYADSLRLRMNESIYPVLKQKDCSTEEFLKIVKGFSLRLAEGSDRMVTVDFSSSETRLTLYYHTPMVESLVYTFVINSETGHCMHFNHDYWGTVLAPIADGTADSLEGSTNGTFTVNYNSGDPVLTPVSSSATSVTGTTTVLTCATVQAIDNGADCFIYLPDGSYTGLEIELNTDDSRYCIKTANTTIPVTRSQYTTITLGENDLSFVNSLPQGVLPGLFTINDDGDQVPAVSGEHPDVAFCRTPV